MLILTNAVTIMTATGASEIRPKSATVCAVRVTSRGSSICDFLPDVVCSPATVGSMRKSPGSKSAPKPNLLPGDAGRDAISPPCPAPVESRAIATSPAVRSRPRVSRPDRLIPLLPGGGRRGACSGGSRPKAGSAFRRLLHRSVLVQDPQQRGSSLRAGADQQGPLPGAYHVDRVPGGEADAADDLHQARGVLGPVLPRGHAGCAAGRQRGGDPRGAQPPAGRERRAWRAPGGIGARDE